VRAQLPARGNKQGNAVSTISLGATMSGRDDLRNWADGILNLGLDGTFGRSRIAKGSRGLLTVATKCVSLVMRLCRHNPEIPVLQRPYYSSVSPVPPFPHGGNSPARVKRTGLPSPVGSSGTSESVRGQTEAGEAALTQRGSDVPAPQPTVCGGRSGPLTACLASRGSPRAGGRCPATVRSRPAFFRLPFRHRMG
jgi:hypothetical protein